MRNRTTEKPSQQLKTKPNNRTNMGTTQKVAMAAILGAAVLAGCKKDKDEELTAPAPVNEEEVITDAYIHFRDDAGNTYQWHASATGGFEHDHDHDADHDHDHDHDGDIQITADTLPANTVLYAEIILLNRSVTPVDTVSHEVLEEGDEHQFFFLPEDVNITTAYDDQDVNGRPIGLKSKWTTGAPSAGEVQVYLRHQPVKDAPGVSGGDITNAGGSNDLEVHFPAVVRVP